MIELSVYGLLVPSRLSINERSETKGNARGLMGRGKKGKRLADHVFKVADEIMVDSGGILNLENRPFHLAYLSWKLACLPFLFPSSYHPLLPSTSCLDVARVSFLVYPPARVCRVLPRDTTGEESEFTVTKYKSLA